MTRAERQELRIQAYHDGELGAFSRWRVEAALRRSPEVRAQLAALVQIGEAARAQESQAPRPAIWETLSVELAGVDRRSADSSENAATGTGAGGMRWLWQPLTAVAVAGAVAWLWLATPAGVLPAVDPVAGSVRSLDTSGRPVVVEERAGSTIIWLMGETADTI